VATTAVVLVSVANDVLVIVVVESDWKLDVERDDRDVEGSVVLTEVGRTDESVDEGMSDEDSEMADDGKEEVDWPFSNNMFPVAVVPFHITGQEDAVSETLVAVQKRMSFCPRTAKPRLGTCDFVIISLNRWAPAALTVKARTWIVV
jgi:hypothetical protein